MGGSAAATVCAGCAGGQRSIAHAYPHPSVPPPDGTHYVADEAITTRLTLPELHSGNTTKMKFDVGDPERQAASTTGYVYRLTQVNFSYTVTADDIDTDGIGIPTNAIVASGSSWLTAGSAFINLNNSALTNQSAHKVIGSPAYLSATNLATLTEANLNGATFSSGVTALSFVLVTTIPNVSISRPMQNCPWPVLTL